MGTKKVAKKASSKKVAKKAPAKSTKASGGDITNELTKLFPDSVVKLLRVLATALVVGKDGGTQADPSIAAALGAALAPNDAAQAKAIAKLAAKAVKDWSKKHAAQSIATPFI
ncbi:MAG: hypothetical protein K1X94_10190 [Sandaracinaceae bacterium]|nr:hypothetical protein [Sandaracinaceae bacterium]